MDARLSMNKRKEMLANVYQLKHNDRVMLAANNAYWNIQDAGYKLSEAVYDYDVLEKTYRNFWEKYKFDIYMMYATTPLLRMTRKYGPHNFKISDDDSSIMFLDYSAIEASEYAEMTQNPDQFLWEKLVPRKMPACRKTGQLQEVLTDMSQTLAFNAKMDYVIRNEYGIMPMWKGSAGTGIESVFSFLRGIKGGSVDMRKHKEELHALDEKMFQSVYGMLQGQVGQDSSEYGGDVMVAMLAHSFMNKKQFEEFYWPQLKQIIDFCVEHHLRIWIYSEAEILRFADYLNYIPKGTAVLEIEKDDLREVRKQIPNIALCGGIPTSLLGRGTEEECISYAKNLIDDLGDGFILSSDKMLCTATDCKRENLLAVNDFVLNYKV